MKMPFSVGSLLIGLLTASEGCGSCASLARAEDPNSFLPDDVAAVLEMDLSRIGNHAIFRSIVNGLWDADSCLITLIVDDASKLVLAMPDTRPDEKSMPVGGLLLEGTPARQAAECLAREFFPEAGRPEEEEYRGVRHWGYPARMPMRIAIVNKRLLLVGDRAGLRTMIDTFLDRKPSLAASTRFAEAKALLPAGAQVRLVSLPGPALRDAARTRLGQPWSSILDARVVAVGLVFAKGELSLAGAAMTDAAAQDIARQGNESVEALRGNRIARILGADDLLGQARFSGSGDVVKLEARASEQAVKRAVSGIGTVVEIGP